MLSPNLFLEFAVSERMKVCRHDNTRSCRGVRLTRTFASEATAALPESQKHFGIFYVFSLEPNRRSSTRKCTSRVHEVCCLGPTNGPLHVRYASNSTSFNFSRGNASRSSDQRLEKLKAGSSFTLVSSIEAACMQLMQRCKRVTGARL